MKNERQHQEDGLAHKKYFKKQQLKTNVYTKNKLQTYLIRFTNQIRSDK